MEKFFGSSTSNVTFHQGYIEDLSFIDDASVLEFECSFAFNVDKDPHVDNMDDLLVQLCQVHLHLRLQMLQ